VRDIQAVFLVNCVKKMTILYNWDFWNFIPNISCIQFTWNVRYEIRLRKTKNLFYL